MSAGSGPSNTTRVRLWTAIFGAVLVVLTVAACSSSSTPPEPSTPPVASSVVSSSAVPSPDPTTQASVAALESYRGFWKAQVEAQAHPTKDLPPALRTYAIDKALANVEATVLVFRQQGIEVRGEPAIAPQVTSVSLGTTPSVSIRDCLDSTNWTPVFTTTGKSALAPNQSKRVVVESTATIYAGRWVIRTSTAYRDRTC